MKKILLEFPGHGNGKIFETDGRNDLSTPFAYLREVLRKRGYELCTADNNRVEGCAGVWFWDATKIASPPASFVIRKFLKNVFRRGKTKPDHSYLYHECIHAGLQDRIVLFTGEPPAVYSPNWDPEVHKMFPAILTWNDDLVDGKKIHKFLWPLVAWFPDVLDVPFNSRKLLVNISGNKFSNHPRELYSVRRETIRYFEKNFPGQFDLYGVGWNQSTLPSDLFVSYRGTVNYKWDVIPHYRFNLCYENMRDETGWVTEKIFDCMIAGSVPIYWGAPNIGDFVDQEAFIDRRKFKSDEELADFLRSMSEKEYSQYRNAIRNYLNSDLFKKFLPPAFADNLISALSL